MLKSGYTCHSTTKFEIVQDVMIRGDMEKLAKSGLNKGFKRVYEML